MGRDVGKCDKCGNAKQMYYPPWCPTCDTPELLPAVTLNFVQVLNKFCVAKGYTEHDTEYDQVWSYACDHGIITGNDTFSNSHLYDTTDQIDEYVYTSEYTPDVTYVKEFYIYVGELYKDQLGQTVLWEISW